MNLEQQVPNKTKNSSSKKIGRNPFASATLKVGMKRIESTPSATQEKVTRAKATKAPHQNHPAKVLLGIFWLIEGRIYTVALKLLDKPKLRFIQKN
jgi:hypothetical protein